MPGWSHNLRREGSTSAFDNCIGPLSQQLQIQYSSPADILYYIQLLAAEIWQYMITSYTVVTINIVNECAKRILALKSDY
jgi:hypothetical protein